MRVSCLACNAELSLDVLLEHEEARAAMGRLVQLTMGSLVLRYVALFRPAKRRLSIDRTVSLLLELLPDMERGAITRKGRDWTVGPDTWRAGFEQMLAARDKGSLTLPLSSHGYLYEVLVGLADKAEAQAERETEEDRRQRRGASDAPLAAAAAIAPAPAAPRPDYSQPSLYARQVRAEIEAKRNQAAAPADGGTE
jgi:hypothetical protein